VFTKEKSVRVTVNHDKDNHLKPFLGSMTSLDGRKCKRVQHPTVSDSIVDNEYEFENPGIYCLKGGLMRQAEGERPVFVDSFVQFYDVKASEIPGTNIRSAPFPVKYGFRPIWPKDSIGTAFDNCATISFDIDKKKAKTMAVEVFEVLGHDHTNLNRIESELAWNQLLIPGDGERDRVRLVVKFPKTGIFKVRVVCLENRLCEDIASYFFVAGEEPTSKCSLWMSERRVLVPGSKEAVIYDLMLDPLGGWQYGC
jgi:hypothetical protein